MFDDSSFIEKMSVVSTIFLAILSYQLYFRSQIPVIPKTTLGDHYMYSAYVVSIVVGVDAFVYGRGKEKSFDKYASLVATDDSKETSIFEDIKALSPFK
jgi:hypothetical protein